MELNYQERLQARFREMRHDLNIPVTTIADKCGVSVRTLFRFVRGEQIKFTTLRKIDEFLTRIYY